MEYKIEEESTKVKVVLVEDGKEIAKATCFFTDTPKVDKKEIGTIGEFDAQSIEYGQAIIEKCEEILKEKGVTQIVAPMNGNTWKQYRTLKYTNGDPLFALEKVNDESYNEILKKSGFNEIHTYSSTKGKIEDRYKSQTIELLEKELEEENITIRIFNKQEYMDDLKKIYNVSSKSFNRNPFYTDISEKEFLKQYTQYIEMVDEELILIAEKDGKEIGFVFCIPDFNELQREGKVHTLVLKTIAVLPEYEEYALGNIMLDRIAKTALNKNYDEWIFAFMYSNNTSQKMASRNNSHIIREYALYGKDIGMNNLAHKLIKNYKKMPDKVCLIEQEKEVTYNELYNKVSNFKEYLQQNGIQKGNKVLVLVPMSIELYITLLSIWSLGATACFMDAGFIKGSMKKNDFEDINAIVGTKKYIFYSRINRNLRKLKTKINVSKIDTLEYNKELDIVEVESDTPAILTYTSGTTGKPKIAARTHEFLSIQGDILKKNLNYEETDIEISTIPIFTLSNINVGITTVIAEANFAKLDDSNIAKIVRQMNKYKVNRIMAAPGLLNVLVKFCKEENIRGARIRKIFTGGGAVFIDLIDELKDIFAYAKITTIYGSTEAEPIAICDVTCINREDKKKIENGYGILAGKIIGVEDCKIIDTDKEEIGDITAKDFETMVTKDVGEIVVTGSNVLKGYVNGVGDAENKFSVDGIKYHRTGDLGHLDKSGRLWLRGRKKEPYFNIEAALHSKLKINKTAVLKNGEKLILVLEKDTLVSEDKIKEAVKFATINEIMYVKKIPVDKRHNTKVDYNELRKVLKI